MLNGMANAHCIEKKGTSKFLESYLVQGGSQATLCFKAVVLLLLQGTCMATSWCKWLPSVSVLFRCRDHSWLSHHLGNLAKPLFDRESGYLFTEDALLPPCNPPPPPARRKMATPLVHGNYSCPLIFGGESGYLLHRWVLITSLEPPPPPPRKMATPLIHGNYSCPLIFLWGIWLPASQKGPCLLPEPGTPCPRPGEDGYPPDAGKL
jgi:hypothetical protein